MDDWIQGIQVRELKKNVDERGYLCELLRADWELYDRFAMTYISLTQPGVVRAWHRHPRTKQTDIFCILQGAATVAVYDDREHSPTRGRLNEFHLSGEKPSLLKLPGDCWHGFKATGPRPALLINFPSELYNYTQPDEERLPPDTKRIPYDWKLDPGLKHG